MIRFSSSAARGVFPVSAYLDPLQRLILADARRVRRRGTSRSAGSTRRCGRCCHPRRRLSLVVDMTQHHMSKMATYTITSAAERGSFDVAIVGNNGTRQTVLGFRTYAAAEAWIADDERRTNEEIDSSFRMQWRF